MVTLSFIPPGNDTDRCAQVDLYESLRPPMAAALRRANYALFGLLIILLGITAVWVYRWRKLSRFMKVRPFKLSAPLLGSFATYSFAALLIPVLDPLVPCWVGAFFYISALCILAVVTIMRSAVIAIETTYSILAKREQTVFANPDDDQSSQSTNQSHISTQASNAIKSFSTLFRLVKVANGCLRITDLSIQDIIITRGHYDQLFSLVTLPGMIVFYLLIALVPEYRECKCEMFVEIPIAVSVVLGFYSFLGLRVLYIAYQVAGTDTKGVFVELSLISGVIAPMAVAVWGLVIADPGQLTYNRQFNWSILFFFTTLAFWYVCFGHQFIYQIRLNHAAKVIATAPETVPMRDMRSTLSKDPAMRQEFDQFATKYYVTESLQFLEDVATFKHFFYEKAETWRMSKFKSLVETYILPESRLEVNISYTLRAKIIDVYERMKNAGNASHYLKAGTASAEEVFTAFDAAEADVDHMICNGVWLEFIIKKRNGLPATPATKNRPLPPSLGVVANSASMA